jgi:ACS family hexuronate transporter-like MFS transporter
LTPWQWKLCLFLLAATTLSYLDRQALSIVAPLIAEELSLNNEQLGRLLAAFFYAYAAMHIGVGWILDRYNIRYTYALFVAGWSLAQMLAGFARGFSELFACRLLLGGLETAGQTGAARIIARTLQPRDRTFANGLMMSGGSLGAILAPPLMIWLANCCGWRFGFLVVGAAGLVWAAGWIFWFRPASGTIEGTRSATTLAAGDQFHAILHSRLFWTCVAGALFTVPIIHISSAWMPTYFVQRWGLRMSGALSGSLFLVYLGLDVGFIGGGWLVSRLIERGSTLNAARVRMLWVSGGTMLVVVLLPLAPNVGFAIAGSFLLNMGRACWGALFLSFNQEIAPGRVGLIAGIMGCLGSLMGALLVWLIGWISAVRGFNLPFLLIGALVVLGTLPLALGRWDTTTNKETVKS